MAVTRSAKAKQDEKNSENPEITKEPLKLDVSSKDVSKTDCDINEKSTSSSSRKRSRRSHDEENFPKQKKVYTAPRTLRRLSQKQVAAVEDKENNGDVHKETVSCVPSPDDPKIVTAAQGEHVTTVKTPRKGRRGRKSGKSAAPKVAEPAAVNPEEELMKPPNRSNRFDKRPKSPMQSCQFVRLDRPRDGYEPAFMKSERNTDFFDF